MKVISLDLKIQFPMTKRLSAGFQEINYLKKNTKEKNKKNHKKGRETQILYYRTIFLETGYLYAKYARADTLLESVVTGIAPLGCSRL